MEQRLQQRLCRFWMLVTAALMLAQVVLLPIPPAYADRIDQMEARVPMALCLEAAGIFDQGAWARSAGIARAIEQTPTGATSMADGGELHAEAMRHSGWDAMTDNERAFFQQHLFAGWDKADAMIIKSERETAAMPENAGYAITALISPAGRSQLTQTYFEKCMEVETAKRTFKKTASNQNIGPQDPCADLEYDIKVIGNAISNGEPKDNLIARAMTSKKLRANEERRKLVMEMIDEAYAWDKPFVEWMDKRYGGCKGI